MISGVLLPLSADVSSEEKRNLLFKLRYGQMSTKVRPVTAENLFVIGQGLRHDVKENSDERKKQISSPTQVWRSTHFLVERPESEVPTGEESSELYCFLSQSNGGEYNDQDLNTPHEPCSSDAKNRKSVMSASSQRRLSRQSSEMSSPSKDGGDMDSKSDEGYMKQGKHPVLSASRGDFGEVPTINGSKQKNILGLEVEGDKRTLYEKTFKHLPASATTQKLPVQPACPAAKTSTTFSSVDGAANSPRRRLFARNDVHVREKNSQSTLLHKAREEKMSSFGKTLSSSRSISEGKKSKFSSRSRTVGSTKKRSFHKEVSRKSIVSCYSEDEIDEGLVKRFSEMPKSKPKNICFDYPGVSVTHLDVKRAIEDVIPDAFETNKVVSLRFENINVKYSTTDLPNRWHIELKDFPTRNKLLKCGLRLHHNPDLSATNLDVAPTPAGNPVGRAAKDHVELKLYDMVTMEEYKRFLRSTAAAEQLQNAILMSAGRGQSLLTQLL